MGGRGGPEALLDYLGLTSGGRVPFATEQDKAAYPINIRLLGAVVIMRVANRLANLLQKTGPAYGIDGVGVRHSAFLTV